MLLLSLFLLCGTSAATAAATIKQDYVPWLVPVGSLRHQDLQVSVYRSSNETNQAQQYYFSPLGLVDSRNASSSFEKFKRAAMLRFPVQLWTDELKAAVHDYVNKELQSECISLDNVNVLPYDGVTLRSTSPSLLNNLYPLYWMQSEWTRCEGCKSVDLLIYCSSKTPCDELLEQMKNNHERFSGLQAKFTKSRPERQQLTISVSSARKSKLLNKILQRFPGADTVLLTFADRQELFAETRQEVLRDTFNEYQIVTNVIDAKISGILEDSTGAVEETVGSWTQVDWDSLYWRNSCSRPDKIIRKLNELHHNSDNAASKRLAKVFSRSSGDAFAGFKQLLKDFDIVMKTSQKTKSSTATTTAKLTEGWALQVATSSVADEDGARRKNEFLRLVEDAGTYVRWTGDKFDFKSPGITRINLQKIRSGSGLVDQETEVSFITAFLSLPLTLEATPSEPVRNFNRIVRQLQEEVRVQVSQLKTEMEGKIEALNLEIQRLSAHNSGRQEEAADDLQQIRRST